MLEKVHYLKVTKLTGGKIKVQISFFWLQIQSLYFYIIPIVWVFFFISTEKSKRLLSKRVVFFQYSWNSWIFLFFEML